MHFSLGNNRFQSRSCVQSKYRDKDQEGQIVTQTGDIPKSNKKITKEKQKRGQEEIHIRLRRLDLGKI